MAATHPLHETKVAFTKIDHPMLLVLQSELENVTKIDPGPPMQDDPMTRQIMLSSRVLKPDDYRVTPKGYRMEINHMMFSLETPQIIGLTIKTEVGDRTQTCGVDVYNGGISSMFLKMPLRETESTSIEFPVNMDTQLVLWKEVTNYDSGVTSIYIVAILQFQVLKPREHSAIGVGKDFWCGVHCEEPRVRFVSAVGTEDTEAGRDEERGARDEEGRGEKLARV